MKSYKSVNVVAILEDSLSIEEMPTAFRSDEWWSEFWRVMGLKEARRIKENTCS